MYPLPGSSAPHASSSEGRTRPVAARRSWTTTVYTTPGTLRVVATWLCTQAPTANHTGAPPCKFVRQPRPSIGGHELRRASPQAAASSPIRIRHGPELRRAAGSSTSDEHPLPHALGGRGLCWRVRGSRARCRRRAKATGRDGACSVAVAS